MSARYTSPHLVRLEERFVIDGRGSRARRARRGGRAASARPPRCWSRRGELDDAADLLRVHDGGRVRAVPRGAGRHRGARGRPRRPARRHQHRDADRGRHRRRSTSITRRSSATRSRRSPPRRPASSSRAFRSSAVRCRDEALAVIAAVCARASTRRSIRTDTDGRARRAGSRRCRWRCRARTSGPTPRSRWRCSTRSTRSHARGCRSVPTRCGAGLTTAAWPGRLERFDVGGCQVLLDAAHNPAGARALASYLRETEPAGVDAGVRRDARQGRARAC